MINDFYVCDLVLVYRVQVKTKCDMIIVVARVHSISMGESIQLSIYPAALFAVKSV